DDAADDPRARAEGFLSSRSDREGKPLHGLFLRASRKRHKYVEASRKRPNSESQPGSIAGMGNTEGSPGHSGSLSWTQLGPSVISSGWIESGRSPCVVAGRGGARVYAGAANGGVWISSDGGASWAPLDDYVVSPSLFGGAAEADSLSIGALAVRS